MGGRDIRQGGDPKKRSRGMVAKASSSRGSDSMAATASICLAKARRTMLISLSVNDEFTLSAPFSVNPPRKITQPHGVGDSYLGFTSA